MNIILLERVEKLGQMGELVTVKSGYARNFLIPTKQAVLPTKENLAKVEEQKQELLKLEEEMKSQALADKDRFNDYKITFEVNIQEEDKLYGSITLQNIMDRLK